MCYKHFILSHKSFWPLKMVRLYFNIGKRIGRNCLEAIGNRSTHNRGPWLGWAGEGCRLYHNTTWHCRLGSLILIAATVGKSYSKHALREGYEFFTITPCISIAICYDTPYITCPVMLQPLKPHLHTCSRICYYYFDSSLTADIEVFPLAFLGF